VCGSCGRRLTRVAAILSGAVSSSLSSLKERLSCRSASSPSAASGFDYLDPDGQLMVDFATLSRIKSLAIPPAWTAVDLPISGRAHPGDRARRAGTRAVPLSLALARDAGRNQI
jgi:hypothetical protein